MAKITKGPVKQMGNVKESAVLAYLIMAAIFSLAVIYFVISTRSLNPFIWSFIEGIMHLCLIASVVLFFLRKKTAGWVLAAAGSLIILFDPTKIDESFMNGTFLGMIPWFQSGNYFAAVDSLVWSLTLILVVLFAIFEIKKYEHDDFRWGIAFVVINCLRWIPSRAIIDSSQLWYQPWFLIWPVYLVIFFVLKKYWK